MFRRQVLVLWMTVVSPLMACSAPSDILGAELPVSFTLDAESFAPFPIPPEVIGSRGGIVIQGRLAFPVACAKAGATGDRDANTIQVVVAVTMEPESPGMACPTALRDAQYRAAVTLSPGIYHLVLIHRLLGASHGEATVFDGEVAVQ
jgi:hypothetical protein